MPAEILPRVRLEDLGETRVEWLVEPRRTSEYGGLRLDMPFVEQK